MDLNCKNIFVQINAKVKEAGKAQRKDLLLVNDVSANFKSGMLVMLMGPSGCGKTTLLNTLYGNVGNSYKTSGELLYNNNKIKAEQWQKETCYLQQEDLLKPDLNVEQCFEFYMSLLRSNLSSFEIDNEIDELLENLNISHIRYTQIKKVSGGEKRRIMIGVEIIANPKIMFLDEPTSALDSATGTNIIRFLKKKAEEKGMIVIVSIHKPGMPVFELFDSMLLMGKGMVLYNGPTNEVESFFAEVGGYHPTKDYQICDYAAEISYQHQYDTLKSKNKELFEYFEETLKKNIQKVPALKSASDYYTDFVPNLFHLKSLFIRRINEIKNNKWIFFKSNLKYTILIFLSSFVMILLWNLQKTYMASELEKLEPKNNIGNSADNKKKTIDDPSEKGDEPDKKAEKDKKADKDKAARYRLITNFIRITAFINIGIIIFFYLFLTIMFVQYFTYESANIQNDLSKGCFSVATYALYMFLHNLIIATSYGFLTFIISFIGIGFLRNLRGFLMIVVLIPLFSATAGAFFGCLSTSKMGRIGITLLLFFLGIAVFDIGDLLIELFEMLFFESIFMISVFDLIKHMLIHNPFYIAIRMFLLIIHPVIMPFADNFFKFTEDEKKGRMCIIALCYVQTRNSKSLESCSKTRLHIEYWGIIVLFFVLYFIKTGYNFSLIRRYQLSKKKN